MSNFSDNLLVGLVAADPVVMSIAVAVLVGLGGGVALFLRRRREIPAAPVRASAPSATPAALSFDPVEALQLCANDQGLLANLLTQLPEEIATMKSAIRTAIDRGDAATAGASAHRLKGALLILAARSAADRALALERAGKQGDTAPLPALADALDEALARVVADIARHNAGGP